MLRIQEWLKECEGTHDECKQEWSHASSFRLIEVSPPGLSSPRIVDSPIVVGNELRYATLSYCWGVSPPVTTTRASLKAFQEALPFDVLAPTHREAIQITRALEIPYLWIDALCIVQDDPHDWEIEAQRMHAIYLNSTVTIAASEADTSSGGCFADSPAHNSASNGRRMYVRMLSDKGDTEKLVHIICRPRGDVYTSALNKRGWVLQQSVLSRRIVHVVNSELQWRCRSKICWESGIRYYFGDIMYGAVPIFNPKPLYPAVNRVERTNRFCWRWLESYSARKLTYEEDGLSAIAGIVNYYADLTADTPILGLWKSSLSEDLTWSVGSEAIHHPREDLPSWSPLSSNHEVYFDRWANWHTDSTNEKPAEIYLRIVHSEVNWTGSPHTSKVSSTSLIVEGAVRYLILSEATETPECVPPKFKVDDETIDCSPPMSLTRFRCNAQFDAPRERGRKRWFCLLLYRMDTDEHQPGREVFLILVPVDTASSPPRFRRVGVGALRRRENPSAAEEQDWKFDMNSQQVLELV